MPSARTAEADLWRMELLHGALAGAAAVCGALTSGERLSGSIALGAGLIWANVWLFKQLFSFLVRPRPARRRLAIALLFAKLPLLWGLVWLIINVPSVSLDGIGLAVGITCFPAAVVIVAIARRRAGAEA